MIKIRLLEEQLIQHHLGAQHGYFILQRGGRRHLQITLIIPVTYRNGYTLSRIYIYNVWTYIYVCIVHYYTFTVSIGIPWYTDGRFLEIIVYKLIIGITTGIIMDIII